MSNADLGTQRDRFVIFRAAAKMCISSGFLRLITIFSAVFVRPIGPESEATYVVNAYGAVHMPRMAKAQGDPIAHGELC